MKFTQLRLSGFKSFVDATDLQIDPGLTGVIGPNGCGKSNLLEALRWVMGATSAKSLRGGGMEELIFAGTDKRPARDKADVLLKIDNSDRRAPARFNDADTLEIVRRITRGKGSDYTINGEDVRAKDVQLLFADASTGANSPALVRQGQISELINAKPENRRRILEDAAGVAGLRARRREAQLRLNAAEANLDRLQEVIDDLDVRHSALQKQARQATRYRKLSADIRTMEALVWLRRWEEAKASVERFTAELAEAETVAEEAIRLAAAATTKAESSQNALQPLREEEAAANAALRLIERERDALERELETLASTISRHDARLEELGRATLREQSLREEARDHVEQLGNTLESVQKQASQDDGLSEETAARFTQAEASREKAEARLEALSTELARLKADRDSAERQLSQLLQRQKRLETSRNETRERLDSETGESAPDLEHLERELIQTGNAVEEAQSAFETSEAEVQASRTRRDEARQARLEAQASVTSLEREAEGLIRMLKSTASDNKALDHVTAQPGYEKALAAALGDDLEASLNDSEMRAWTLSSTEGLPLPDGVTSLASVVDAPVQLKLRLEAIGVVGSTDLGRLSGQLQPGQRLVTQDGDLIRWDGLTAKAGAPSSAAARLENRNRLKEVESLLKAAVEALETSQTQVEDHEDACRKAETAFSDARRSLQETQSAQREAERTLATAREAHARLNERQSALQSSLQTLELDLSELDEELEKAQARIEAVDQTESLETRLDEARTETHEARQKAAEARAERDSVLRDIQSRQQRLSALEREKQDWSRRLEAATGEITRLADEEATIKAALEEARTLPEQHETKLKEIMDRLGEAESKARLARDRLVEVESGQRDADSLLRAAEKEASAAREARAACQARLDGARERLSETIERLEDATGDTPEALTTKTGDSDLSSLSSEEVERRLETARASRERLGAVNLRADEEAEELQEQRDTLTKERDDLVEAVSRLRKAVDTLSREGRARLLEAFDVVNEHFQRLFQTLFGGGHAELRLTESDDPLEAGLEIMACPPGKKLDNMNLMSGGEQALTATALIFAVFLSNPAPVCVLDEVDAPLDDANVDRFCRMLEEMRRLTETRFLIITHNPVTMARMDRLYGVTMAERGVSQLVSVSLNAAEDLIAAE